MGVVATSGSGKCERVYESACARAREREFMERQYLLMALGGVEAAAQAEEEEKGEECNLFVFGGGGCIAETSVFGT